MSSVSVKHREVNALIGCPYKVHGRSIEEGFDCYGVDIEVYKIHGMYLPDIDYDNPEQYEDVFEEMHGKVEYEKIDNPQILCIIVFRVRGESTHTGIYLGDGLFIHATKDKGVRAEPLHRWINRVEGYYKVSSSRNNQESV